MNITWTSRQGRTRRANSDAAAVGYINQYLVAVVVDAAEKIVGGRLIAGTNDKGKRLAQHWADSCLCELITSAVCQNEDSLIECLHRKQTQLSPDYLHDIASYGVLVMNTTAREFNWWFTGDCRLGIQTEQGEIHWQGNPHRLEYLPLLNSESMPKAQRAEIKQAARHTLSRSLNARRFYRPEKVTAQLPANQHIVIATDGHWCEHLSRGVAIESLEDDASLLTIKPGKRMLSLAMDAPNLFVMYR